jgi:hypothetical protein
MQVFKGHVTDEEEFKHEVFISLGPADEPDHVFVMYGGAQVTDFPFGQPQADCDLCQGAQLVATGEKDSVSLPILVS